jgi:4-aminobutyrate aminotransferase-like enzyme
MAGNFALPAPNAYRSIFRHKDGSYDWKTELDYGFALIDRQSCGSLAAVILEPILSSAGMHPLPAGYLKAVREHCDKRGMLLIIDEAQTAIGRAGDMFAFQFDGDGVIPDILTLSKTLGNGIPLSAVVTSDKIAEYARENHFLFYTTHINDPLPAAVGEKVLEIVVRDNLVEHSRKLGKILQTELGKLKSRYGCIGDVRGRGLMAGIEIVTDSNTKEPALDLGNTIARKMAELGLWAQLGTMQSFAGTFRLAPPITISEAELLDGLAIMEAAFAATEGTLPLYKNDENDPKRVDSASEID